MRPLRSALALILAAVVGAAGCARAEPIPLASGPPETQTITLPEPTPAIPAYVVQSEAGFSSAELGSLRDTPGAALVVPADLNRMKVKGAKGVVWLRVAAVDPLSLRPVAPAATRDAEFVWLALLSGEAIVTHEAGAKLGIDKVSEVEIGRSVIRVGAVAEIGTPNFADVIIARPEADDDGVQGNVAVVGAESGITLQLLGKDLKSRVPGSSLHRLDHGVKITVPKLYGPLTVAPSTGAGGLHPTMAAVLSRLLAAADGRVWAVSGYRTPEHQYRLWVDALNKYGDPEIADNWVAPPGYSMHERGVAVDLGGDIALAVRLVGELGLPLWRPMSWEPWHFELTGSRG